MAAVIKPTIGRIVHFVLDNGSHRAAMVINVLGSGRPNLNVFLDPSCDPDSAVFAQAVGYDETGKTSGTWHWPERD